MAPSLVSDTTSTSTTNGSSGCFNMGAVVKGFFSSLKAASAVALHFNFFMAPLSRDVSGGAIKL